MTTLTATTDVDGNTAVSGQNAIYSSGGSDDYTYQYNGSNWVLNTAVRPDILDSASAPPNWCSPGFAQAGDYVQDSTGSHIFTELEAMINASTVMVGQPVAMNDSSGVKSGCNGYRGGLDHSLSAAETSALSNYSSGLNYTYGSDSGGYIGSYPNEENLSGVWTAADNYNPVGTAYEVAISRQVWGGSDSSWNSSYGAVVSMFLFTQPPPLDMTLVNHLSNITTQSAGVFDAFGTVAQNNAYCLIGTSSFGSSVFMSGVPDPPSNFPSPGNQSYQARGFVTGYNTVSLIALTGLSSV